MYYFTFQARAFAYLFFTCLQVQVWSTGVTLQGWVDDLRAAGCINA